MNAPEKALLRRSRPYIFWGQTQSLCETCLVLVPTKIQILGEEVWYEKRCKQHGVQSTLVSTDSSYWRRCKEFIKPGDKPLAFQRPTEFGCPFDCGLCPDHEQHSCLALIEITEHCNLRLPDGLHGHLRDHPAAAGSVRRHFRRRRPDRIAPRSDRPDVGHDRPAGGSPRNFPDLGGDPRSSDLKAPVAFKHADIQV